MRLCLSIFDSATILLLTVPKHTICFVVSAMGPTESKGQQMTKRIHDREVLVEWNCGLWNFIVRGWNGEHWENIVDRWFTYRECAEQAKADYLRLND